MKSIFPRKIEKDIKKQLDNNQALVVTGMRRAGKTTLLRRLFNKIASENKKWFDFENPLDIKNFEEIDYNHIVDNLGLDKRKRMFVFIDEIQHFPEISKIIKYLIDHYQIKFVVTGSASYYLKNLFPESLAGRKRIFELFPLDFEEFLLFKGENYKAPRVFRQKANLKSRIGYEKFSKLFDEFIRFGGFPEVITETDIDNKEARLKEIFSSYYEKEVLGLSGFRKSKEVRDLIILLTSRLGAKLDITKISQELGVNRITIGNYLHFLEKSYFIYLIQPFSKSIDREISGQPKVYLCDNGLAQAITQLNSGQLLENAVFNLLKFYGKINFYQRRRSGQEIDFILDGKIGFEVKQTGTKIDLRRLAKLTENLNFKEFYLISKNFIENQNKVIYPQFF